MAVKHVTRRGEQVWVIDFGYQGPQGQAMRYRRNAQVNTRSGAVAEERRIMQRLAETGNVAHALASPTSDRHGPTFGAAVTEFARKRLPKLKPSTRVGYVAVLGGLGLEGRDGEGHLAFLRDVPTASIRRGTIEELDTKLCGLGLAASTRRNVQIVLRAVLRSALTDAQMALLRPPPLPRVGRKVPRSLDRETVDKIIQAASETGKLGLSLVAYAGLRPAEVRGLRVRDVSLRERTLSVRVGVSHGEESATKSGHERVVPIASALLPVLTARLTKPGDANGRVALTDAGKPWGQSGLAQAFDRAVERADADTTLTIYDLRHFFATELIRRGVSAPAVQKLLGHHDLSVTQRYVDVVGADLKAAIAKFD